MLDVIGASAAGSAILTLIQSAWDLAARVQRLRAPLGLLAREGERNVQIAYDALSEARPIVADIAERAFRGYLLWAGRVTVLLLGGLLCLWSLRVEWAYWLMIAVSGVVMLFAWFYKPHWARNMKRLAADVMRQRWTEALSKWVRDAQRSAAVALNDAKLANDVRARRVSAIERGFLKRYLQAESMIRSLECHRLVGKLSKGVDKAHDALTDHVVDVGAAEIIRLAKEDGFFNAKGRLTGEAQKRVKETLSIAGIGHLVDCGSQSEWLNDDNLESVITGNRLSAYLRRMWAPQRLRPDEV